MFQSCSALKTSCLAYQTGVIHDLARFVQRSYISHPNVIKSIRDKQSSRIHLRREHVPHRPCGCGTTFGPVWVSIESLSTNLLVDHIHGIHFHAPKCRCSILGTCWDNVV